MAGLRMVDRWIWTRLEKNSWGGGNNGDVVSEEFSSAPIAGLCRTNKLSHRRKLVAGGQEQPFLGTN